jgi:hypothetical protein
MILDFSVSGEVTVDMVTYLLLVIADMPKDMKGAAPTPATAHLFKVSNNPVPLTHDRAEIFH